MIKIAETLYIPESCCGCLACVDVCPRGVLKQSIDREGFPIPEIIHLEQCIDCGLCLKSCKIHNATIKQNKTAGTSEHRTLPNAYIAIGKDRRAIKRSSSGGIFWSIAKTFIKDLGGFVVGASINSDLLVNHDITDKVSGLKNFQGSKYVQSDTSGIFLKTKKLLASGNHVLFSGTPCQVKALKLFLPKDLQQNLLTIDIICHGIASPKLFHKYIRSIEEIENREVIGYKFRWKNPIVRSDSNYYMIIMMKSGLSHIGVKTNDVYMKSYLDGICFRESCYTCPFASLQRVGDISLGDCDSRNLYPWFHSGEASSTLILNTTKGVDFYTQHLRNEIDDMPIDLIKESEVNHQLRHPFHKPIERITFYQKVLPMTANDFLSFYGYRKCFIENLKVRILMYMPSIIIKIIANLRKQCQDLLQ